MVDFWQGTGNRRWYWSVVEDRAKGKPPRLYCTNGTHTQGFATRAEAEADFRAMLRAAQTEGMGQ